MTDSEVKKITENIELLEDGVDSISNFKKNMRNLTSLVIEGTWFVKERNKIKDNKVSIVTDDKSEIMLMKQFIVEYEKYLLKQYNAQVEKLQKAGIDIENKYKK